MQGLDLAGVVAAVVALVILADVSVLWVLGKPVPELLGQLIFGVFGFYFGRDRGPATRATAPPAEGSTPASAERRAAGSGPPAAGAR